MMSISSLLAVSAFFSRTNISNVILHNNIHIVTSEYESSSRILLSGAPDTIKTQFFNSSQ